jgi:phospholipase/lecithinase/hemolysin
MSLSELSKLAELLRIELATQNMSEIEASASIIKMQQSLFAQLAQYQKSHVDFIITEKYLNVLTDNQVQQLKPNAKKAVSEN